LKAHRGQWREFAETPAIHHPLKVARLVGSILACYEPMKLKSERGEDIVKAALLHDTLEDTKTTRAQISSAFGENTANIVMELTIDDETVRKMRENLGDIEGRAEYLSEKMNAMSSDALIIKLADRLNNLQDVNNTGHKDERFRDKYSKETEIIISKLEQRIAKESKAHNDLFDQIKEVMKRIA